MGGVDQSQGEGGGEMIGCDKCPRESLDNYLCSECESANKQRLAQRVAEWEATNAWRDVVAPVNAFERIVGLTTEYRCRSCGEWAALDNWQCLGNDLLDDPDSFGPDEIPPYDGDDAIDCPRCGERQPTPGLIPAQLTLRFW